MDTLISQTFQTTDSKSNHKTKCAIGQRELLKTPKEDAKKEDFLHDKNKRGRANFCSCDHYFLSYSNVAKLLVSSSAIPMSNPGA